MALDLYAGSLARYYTQNWENVVQVYARKSGQTYQKVGPTNQGALPSWDDVAAASRHWLGVINEQLKGHLHTPIEWSEEREVPYFTDRPGYDGWGALVTASAYAVAGQTMPSVLAEDWMGDPIVAAAMGTKES